MSEGLTRLLDEIQVAPAICVEDLAGSAEVSAAIWQSLELFVRAAWGSTPPRSTLERQGWLDSANMQTYCRLKKFAVKNYGQGQWSSFVENKLAQLPGVGLMPRQDVWARTILSDTCASY